MIDEQGHRLGF